MDSHHITHGESIWERLDVLRDKGSHGAKTCVAMGAFLKERASVENAYGQALIKAVTRARGARLQGSMPQPSWAPSLVREGWAGVITAINSWGKQHVGWALCIDQNISKTLAQYATKHEGHVKRLWTEAQELVNDLEVVQGEYYRAKDAYERACIDATRLLDERNKARESAAAATVQESGNSARGISLTTDGVDKIADVPTPPNKEVAGGSVLSSVSKMLEKVSEGMAMAVAIAAGDLTLDELEEKVPELLQKVDVAESEYIASIMAVNGYTTEFQPELESKLNQFQLLEESRIMHVREALLRLDQATKGMLDCLLGPGGTLEALSAALSRVDIVQDAGYYVKYVREQAGLPLSPAVNKGCSESIKRESECGQYRGGMDEAVVVAPPCLGQKADSAQCMIDVHEAQSMTGVDISELGEDGLPRAFEGTRDVSAEGARVIQEMCCCLAEVVAVQENYVRDLLRLLARQGYGDRVAQSGVASSRGSVRVVADLHAIGATMEDVGKNVMANMSGTPSSSSICAKAVAGEGKTLTEGWESSAVSKALVGLEAHTRLTHGLGGSSCSAASKVHEEAKASVAHASKLFMAGSKQVVAAKTAHSKLLFRYDKICRELREKQDLLAKARVDLDTELQASRAVTPDPSTPPKSSTAAISPDAGACGTLQNPSGAANMLTGVSTADHPVNTDALRTPVGSDTCSAEFAGSRRDGPWMLETLGLGQGASNRVRALELRIHGQVAERDTAKQAVEESVEGVEAALVNFRQTTKDIAVALFTEEENRQKQLTQLLDGVLSALLDTVKVFKEEQMRADELGTTRNIDGRRDVEELVRRNAHSTHPLPAGSAIRARSGQGDGVNEVMFMAYHNEVLQQERDLRRRTHLSNTSATVTASDRQKNGGLRLAGGGGHPLFTAMAEAALAQAHAKQQQRQSLSRGKPTVNTSPRARTSQCGPGVVCAATQYLSATSLTDEEGGIFTKYRSRRRYRRIAKSTNPSVECYSDSELLACVDTSLSRHGGSLHGMLRRGSRHDSRQNSRQGTFRSSRSSPRQRIPTPDLAPNESQTSSDTSLDSVDLDPAKGDGDQSAAQAVSYSPEGALSGSLADHDKDVEHSTAAFEVMRFESHSQGTPSSAAREDVASPVGTGLMKETTDNSQACRSEESTATKGAVASKTVSSMKQLVPGVARGHQAGIIPNAVKAADQASREDATRGVAKEMRPSDNQIDENEQRHSPRIVNVDCGQGSCPAEVEEQQHEAESVIPIPFLPTGGQRQADEAENLQVKDLMDNKIMFLTIEVEPGDFSYPTEEMGPYQVQFADNAFPTEELGANRIVEGHAPFPSEEDSARGMNGRPSLRSLRHRVTYHDDGFSSGGEAGDMTSTDEDQFSERSTEILEHREEGGMLASSTGERPPSNRESEGASRESPSPGDKVIESYSCALYGPGLPLHGRLSISADSARFSGWRNTKVILALSDITAIEKTSTLGIVPNALTFIRRDGEKITLGSFLYRDDCYTLLTRVMNVSSSISRLGDGSLMTAADVAHSSTPAGSGIDGRDEVESTAESVLVDEPSETDPGVAILQVSGVPSTPRGSFDVVVDSHLPCTVAQAFRWLWGHESNFWADFLRDQGEVDLDISRWKIQGPSSQELGGGRGLKELFPGESFHAQRELTFTHLRTGFVVGPKKVFTRQTQGYRLERRTNQNGAEVTGVAAPLDQIVLCQSTRMERVALAEHFTILGQMLLIREPPSRGGGGTLEPRCRVVISFDVAFHKSTMLRGAVRSGALEETVTNWKAWMRAAEKVVAYQGHKLGRAGFIAGVTKPPPPRVFELASRFTPRGYSVDEAATGSEATEVAVQPIGEGTTVTRKQHSGPWSLVVRHVLPVLKSFGLPEFPGTPTMFTLFCLVAIVMQQFALRRLAWRVEELTSAVSELQEKLA